MKLSQPTLAGGPGSAYNHLLAADDCRNDAKSLLQLSITQPTGSSHENNREFRFPDGEHVHLYYLTHRDPIGQRFLVWLSWAGIFYKSLNPESPDLWVRVHRPAILAAVRRGPHDLR